MRRSWHYLFLLAILLTSIPLYAANKSDVPLCQQELPLNDLSRHDFLKLVMSSEILYFFEIQHADFVLSDEVSKLAIREEMGRVREVFHGTEISELNYDCLLSRFRNTNFENNLTSEIKLTMIQGIVAGCLIICIVIVIVSLFSRKPKEPRVTRI